MPALLLRTQGGPIRTLDLEGRAVRVGRSPDCDLPIEDESVSRFHAEIRLREGRWWVRDLGSSNGTFVNGEPVTEAELGNADRIRLGKQAELEFRADANAISSSRSLDAPPVATRPGRARPGSARRAPGEWLGFLRASRFALASGHATIPLTHEVTLVGRDPAANLTIDDESVSRTHARLERRQRRLVVTDLKSRNGTRVNGENVVKAELDLGDRVEFGSVEFEVRRDDGVAWARIAAIVAALAVAAVAIVGLQRLTEWTGERAAVTAAERRLEAQAVQSVRRGIEASRRGDLDYARSYLLYAADLLQLSGLAPRGATLDRPAELFAPLLRELPAGDRDFDFERALDPGTVSVARERLERLSDREYVERQVKRMAIELGQDQDVPPGFVDQVWAYVQENVRHPGKFQQTLRRAVRIQPRLREILTESHLPEVFCYVAWTESDLSPTATSPARARGLWQFTAETGRIYGLRVEPGRGIDERLDVNKSTRAATRYIGNLIRTFGREQFMCALASYNRGEGGVRRAMERIPDPMMASSKKYWYLVENGLLPRETSEYVSRIFTASVLAGDPRRFGFEPS